MTCPTCGHSIQMVVNSDAIVHVCPRCGTLREQSGTEGIPNWTVPKLVEMCREFAAATFTPDGLSGLKNTEYHDLWRSLGIAESIATTTEAA